MRPKNFDPGPPAGDWRKAHAVPRRDDRLFSVSLVAISGEETGWKALEQAIIVAKKENGLIRGVHVLPPEAEPNDLETLRNKFESLCDSHNINHEFLVEKGNITERISILLKFIFNLLFSINSININEALVTEGEKAVIII